MDWSPPDAVAAARRLSGRMSQAELATRLTTITTGDRWTRNMVASLEGGRKVFDVDTLIAVSRALDVSTDFILFGPNADDRS